MLLTLFGFCYWGLSNQILLTLQYKITNCTDLLLLINDLQTKKDKAENYNKPASTKCSKCSMKSWTLRIVTFLNMLALCKYASSSFNWNLALTQTWLTVVLAQRPPLEGTVRCCIGPQHLGKVCHQWREVHFGIVYHFQCCRKYPKVILE